MEVTSGAGRPQSRMQSEGTVRWAGVRCHRRRCTSSCQVESSGRKWQEQPSPSAHHVHGREEWALRSAETQDTSDPHHPGLQGLLSPRGRGRKVRTSGICKDTLQVLGTHPRVTTAAGVGRAGWRG